MFGHDLDVGHGSGVAGVDDRAVVGFAVCGGHRDGPHQVSQRLAVVNAEIEQIEAVAAALSEKVGRREMSVADFNSSYGFLRAVWSPCWRSGISCRGLDRRTYSGSVQRGGGPALG